MEKMPTVKDVALLAGVSVGTVSRVLAGEAAVKPALRDKVRAAIDELGYRPNVAARALRTNRTNVVGLIIPDITNPFFAQLAASVETAAMKFGHMVMLATSHNDGEAERNHLKAFLDRSVDGIIVVAVSEGSLPQVETPVPIVSLDRRYGAIPLVSTDHAQAAALVVDHLHGLGHRRIAYIAGPQGSEAGRLRKEGFVARVKELTRPGDEITLEIIPGRFDYASGESAAREVLARPAQLRPTAIAAASDQQAIGVLRAARDLRIDVPGALSVTGFDDINLADLVVPRLTTVRQPTDLLAQRAVEQLLGDKRPTGDEVIEGTLIVRRSTGPLPDRAA